MLTFSIYDQVLQYDIVEHWLVQLITIHDHSTRWFNIFMTMSDIHLNQLLIYLLSMTMITSDFLF